MGGLAVASWTHMAENKYSFIPYNMPQRMGERFVPNAHLIPFRQCVRIPIGFNSIARGMT
jgi:hypothetical protein